MSHKSLPIQQRKKNIAILGGAFNPITKGHIQIGEFLLKNLVNLSEIWIMPCFTHVYHKKLIHSDHRLKMCKLALENHENIKLFDYEIQKGFTRGSYFLLKDLLKEDFVINKYQIYMIIGMDNANTFEKWIENEKLKNLIPFIVIPRQGVNANPGVTWFKQPPHVYIESQESIMEVSSTEVRNFLENKDFDNAQDRVHPKVFQYIMDNNLYQT